MTIITFNQPNSSPGVSVYAYYTSMLRLYWLCRLVLPPAFSDSRCAGSVRLMKELKDFKVVNTVVSSSRSILGVNGVVLDFTKGWLKV